MIKLLHIENIAVIEKADIEFSPGLNVLTGETGAGKSIVIDALSVVTGGRTSREGVRTGAGYASVTAVFTGDDTQAWFEENSIEPDESGDIFISRKVSADGKNTCRVNGSPASAAQLRELGAALLDIHGQNDGRKLLDEGTHLAYLDAFGRHKEMLETYRSAYGKYREKEREIEKLTMDESEKAQRIDLLRYQIEEIGRAKLRPGEMDELTSRRELLLNASKLTESVETAFELLYGGDNTSGATARINEAHIELDRAARYSDGLRILSERLLELRYTTQDIAEELRDFRSQLEFSPDELNEIEARLDTLKRLTRKYGDEEAALDWLEKNSAELSDIEDSTNKLKKLNTELAAYLKEAKHLAAALSETRKATALALQERIMDELSGLNMPGVHFSVEFGDTDAGPKQTEAGTGLKKDAISAKPGQTISSAEPKLTATGSDEVRFLMSANAGESPGRISRIASGGELARIMLAMKNVLSGEADTGTMVFDEIDAGVSGIAAQRVGEKLATLAKRRQVLCVTHLPQIAVMADTHFEIQKTVSGGRTFTHVETLDFEGRRQEISRLSGGENITATTLESASEQLAAAEAFKMHNA